MRKPKLVSSQQMPPSPVGTTFDPDNLNARLYRECSDLLDDIHAHRDDLTVRDRITALVAIGRMQTIFMGLRKEKGASDNVGSSVRKYAAAFSKDAAHQREAGASRTTDAAAGSDDLGISDWGSDPDDTDGAA